MALKRPSKVPSSEDFYFKIRVIHGSATAMFNFARAERADYYLWK